jgi:hypothetical protein
LGGTCSGSASGCGVAEAPQSGRARRPDLFIIGAPKCGTTSLYEYLAGHPNVFMSPVKEPFYFCPDVVRRAFDRFAYGRDEAAYLNLFAGAKEERRVGEASTRYMLSAQAPQLVYDFQPTARLVAMVRNPVDMLPALHNERVSLGLEPILEFDAAFAADADRRAGRRLPPGTDPLLAEYRQHAKYGEHLQRWIDVFGRSALHVVVFDDFVADTPTEFRHVLEFLDVDPDYRPGAFRVRNRSHRTRQGVNALARTRPVTWLTHTLLTRAVGSERAARTRRRMRHTRLLRRPHERPPIAPEVRRAIEAELRSDVDHLSRIVGRDIGALWFGGPARE